MRMEYREIAGLARRIRDNVEKVIVGKGGKIDLILAAVIAGGHILLEDVPGTGKTVMARSLARSLRCGFPACSLPPTFCPPT